MDHQHGVLWMFTEGQKQLMDFLSLGAAVSAILGVLPAISMLVTIIYGVIRIFETDTVRKMLGKKKRGRRHGS